VVQQYILLRRNCGAAILFLTNQFQKGSGANDSRHMKKLIIRRKMYWRSVQMKSSGFKSYDDLPLFLNAETVAKALGISISGCYELLKAKDFPSITIGNRIVVPKDRFIQWAEDQSQRKMN
jgi:predicted DNA-binding transcriptional regulator AlpA